MKPALCKFIRIWGVVRPELNLGPGSGYSIWELSGGLVCGGGGYSERRNFLFRSEMFGGCVCMQGQRRGLCWQSRREVRRCQTRS